MLSKYVLLSALFALATTAAPTEPTGVVDNPIDKCGGACPSGSAMQSSSATTTTSAQPSLVKTTASAQPQPKPTVPVVPPAPGPHAPPPPSDCKECECPKPFEKPMPDGYALYQISPADNQKLCLAVDTITHEGNWLSNDRDIVFEECDERNTGQLWALPIDNKRDGALNLGGSNFCVDSGTVYPGTEGPQNAAHFKVYQCYKDNSGAPIRSQDFKFGADGTIRMVNQNRDCDACLDIQRPGGQYNWGTAAQVWDCNAPGSGPNANQVFVRKGVRVAAQ